MTALKTRKAIRHGICIHRVIFNFLAINLSSSRGECKGQRAWICFLSCDAAKTTTDESTTGAVSTLTQSQQQSSSFCFASLSVFWWIPDPIRITIQQRLSHHFDERFSVFLYQKSRSSSFNIELAFNQKQQHWHFRWALNDAALNENVSVELALEVLSSHKNVFSCCWTWSRKINATFHCIFLFFIIDARCALALDPDDEEEM